MAKVKVTQIRSSIGQNPTHRGTLRALGFRRRSILFSFLLESTLLCLAGGILGCLATLPSHASSAITTGTAPAPNT